MEIRDRYKLLGSETIVVKEQWKVESRGGKGWHMRTHTNDLERDIEVERKREKRNEISK